MRIDRHAYLAAAATFVLMVMGSLVHGTGSSLACPDWPLCHGSFFPSMTGGVEFEHSHRLMAAAVVVLTLTLFARALRGDDRPARWLMAAACGLVAVQAVLGGLTVLYRLPPAISIAHLATSMTFLSVLVLVSARLTARSARVPGACPRAWVGAAALLVLAQVVLGGLVRHTGAAFACSGVPFCGGSPWPVFWLGRVHMLHRATGALALLAVVAVSLGALRRGGSTPGRALALAPGLLALAQVAMGVAVVLAPGRLDLVTAHHAGGALLLASLALRWGLAGPKEIEQGEKEKRREKTSFSPSLPVKFISRFTGSPH
jgi:heme A synthase